MRMFTRLMFLSTLGWGLGCSGQAPVSMSNPGEDAGGATGHDSGATGDDGGSGGSSGGQGTAPGDSGGAACSVNGSTYASGSQFPSGSCNVCICNDGQFACTTLNCPVPSDGGTNVVPHDASVGSVGDSGLPTTGTATGTEVFTPAQVQAARANCSLAHGPVQSITTFGAAYTAITGSWLLCSLGGDVPTQGWGLMSREYDANGQWYSLGLDAQGGMVRLLGVDNQGTWQIEDGSNYAVDGGASTPIASVLLNMAFDTGGGNGGIVAWESTPTRMSFNPDYFEAQYVPLGH